jgi:hypothetical protein
MNFSILYFHSDDTLLQNHRVIWLGDFTGLLGCSRVWAAIRNYPEGLLLNIAISPTTRQMRLPLGSMSEIA